MNSTLIFVLMCMIFCHIVDDFYLQGILAKMKQKSWWKEQVKEDYWFYRHDYIPALLAHAFSWAFMIMLPIAIYLHLHIGIPFIIYFIMNMITHAIVDNLKVNQGVMNLCFDQVTHIMQIIITWAVLVI